MLCSALLMATPALSQEPSELTKKNALLQAYRMNGNSMVGNGRMIDLSKPNPDVDVREKDGIVCGWVKGDVTGSTFYECHDITVDHMSTSVQVSAPAGTIIERKPVRTVSIEPTVTPKAVPDVCRRHGLRKTWNKAHDYWNCRRR